VPDVVRIAQVPAMWMRFIVVDFYLGFDGIYEGGGWGERYVLIFDEESIAAFRERVSSMISAVFLEVFSARPSYMGCGRCDYRDLCEVGEKGEGEEGCGDSPLI
jgi:hypothetical protein